MISRIDRIIEDVIRTEGGYSNDPDDAGGETMYGITVEVARANGYLGQMQYLPIELARSIYRKRYIEEPRFNAIAEISPEIGTELVDTGVNMGPHRAAEFLQRWLNGLNDTGSRYQKLFIDGRVGDVTLSALRAFLNWRGAEGITVLLRGLNSVQGTRYLERAEAEPKNKRFLYGWILQRVSL